LKLLQKIYETYLESLNPDGKPYIFLDEIQEVVLSTQKEQILLSYFDDVVNKNFVRRYKIRKP